MRFEITGQLEPSATAGDEPEVTQARWQWRRGPGEKWIDLDAPYYGLDGEVRELSRGDNDGTG